MNHLILTTVLLMAGLLQGMGAEEATPGPVEIPVITIQDAAQNDGKTVTVRGKVDGQRKTASGTTFLNFGGRHPNQVFSCRVFGDKFPEGVPSCEGKTVEVTGKIKMHDGKPTMDLGGPDKLKIIEEEASTPVSP